MFVQIIKGRVRDATRLQDQMERWERELEPEARGYLGSTIGVSDDGIWLALARFESEEAARRNSDRPEQTRWWEETAGHLERDVEFYDTTDVALVQGGGSDDAHFVQVMHGRASDVERVRILDSQVEEWVKKYRPDHLGALIAWMKDGRFFHFVYFTSEAEARGGERRMDSELPEEARVQLEERRSLIEDLTYVDLRNPRLESA